MDSRGNVFMVFGMRSTGKSKDCRDIAETFRSLNKRVIILDHSGNDDTYGDIPILDVKELAYKLPKNSIFRVQSSWQDFLLYSKKLCNSCILIDDATDLFRGRSPEAILTWCGTAKNQRLEIIFQMHNISEVAPDLLRKAYIWILKETNDPFPLKKTIKYPKIIENILKEIIAENMNYEEEKKWATRMIDFPNEKVYVKDLVSNDYHDYKKLKDYL